MRSPVASRIVRFKVDKLREEWRRGTRQTEKMRSPVKEIFIYVGSEMFPLERRVTRYSQNRKSGNVRLPV
jgi:hypothetical protein